MGGEKRTEGGGIGEGGGRVVRTSEECLLDSHLQSLFSTVQSARAQ